ncbi:glycosyltransferase family 2 protein [Candidatus Uhrbacteria bacterium]|nr:glycosyltransferase family 2 protein [Candidatus Uhrbacteria bacterium]
MNEHPGMPRVAVIIPTFNGQQYVNELFGSINASMYPKDRLGIFVIDNASRDAMLSRIVNISALLPQLHVIKNPKNYYFAKAINQGAKAAINKGYDVLFLLNQDTVLDADCIQRLVNALQSFDKDRTVVQARMMIWPPESERVNSLGNRIHYLGFGFSDGNGKEYAVSSVHGPAFWPVTYASGGAMMVSATLWEESGGFSEILEMYHEDLEFGWRLNLSGGQSICVRDAIVYHKYNSSPSGYKYYFMERNRLLVMLMHYQSWTLFLLAPMALVLEAGMLAFAIRNGWWKQKLRSYRDVLRLFPGVFAVRRKSMDARIKKDSEILQMMSSQITDQPIPSTLLDRVGNPLMHIYYKCIRGLV